MILRTHDLCFQDIPGVIAATSIESAGEIALVETGPDSCRESLVKSLAASGIQPGDVKKVFVTHIHLDHSGGAGWWAQQGAQIYLHKRGAPHLVEPARLIASAAQIYGDEMQRLWGDILPAPAERVTALNDGESVAVGEVALTAWDTPGHARHHLCFTLGKTCFTGDVAGMRLQGSGYLSVTSAPPQFEPPAYLQSLDRLLAADFETLRLTHFGEVSDVHDHLSRYRARIIEVTEQVRQWKREGQSAGELVARYRESERAIALQHGIDEHTWQKLEATNSTAMCASGINLWLEKDQS
jgi:glyoxylase-like metal-dependent hydrolase (beta-lactamase superfamily II)